MTPINVDELKAEAKAYRERMASPLWKEETKGEELEAFLSGSSVASLNESSVGVSLAALPLNHAPGASVPESVVVERLDALSSKLAELVSRSAIPGVPVWILDTAGDPRTYDSPSKGRKNVCVRIAPSSYEQLQRAQTRLGLRTTAGAWEYVLRLGLAVADRLPVGGSG